MSRKSTIYTSSPEYLVPEPDRYPVAEWASQRTKYWEYYNHFDGDWLDDKVGQADPTPAYPLQLNPFNMACMLHAAFLFGEVQDGSHPLVKTIVEPWSRGATKEERDDAAYMSDYVNRVWEENRGRSIQQEAGIIMQVMGGCVFGVAYDPSYEPEGRTPIRIDHVLPEFFFPVWAPNDYMQLLSCIISFQVNRAQAKAYYDVEAEYDMATYLEFWTPEKCDISVDGKPAKWNGLKIDGRPVGGFVPYTYIPHVRIGEFYGVSLLDRKLDLAKEVNSVFAELGDIVGENARSLPVIWNVARPSVRRLDAGITLVDLGQGRPGMGEPGIAFPTGVQVNAPTVQWASALLDLARIEAYTPPVVYGLDEGSQRSALTLAFRMIPLIAHIRHERTNFTDGKNQIDRRILLVAAEKELDPRITFESLKRMRIYQDWAPVLPRDREQEVNEVILRHNANLISPDRALEKLGDVQDISTEMNLIKKWMEFSTQTGAANQGNPFGGSSTGGELAGLTKPDKPKASLQTKEG